MGEKRECGKWRERVEKKRGGRGGENGVRRGWRVERRGGECTRE